MLCVMYSYYIHQNNKEVIGGKISKAKTFWLGYAMFHYFILPLWILAYISQDHDAAYFLYIILGIFYFRMLLQTVLMFVTRTWSPVIGISYNAVASIALIVISVILIQSENWTLNNYILLFYILNLILILLTDTYYARRFHQLVGNETKGKTAIWFASEEEKFKQINLITQRNNVIFILLSLFLLLLLLIYGIH